MKDIMNEEFFEEKMKESIERFLREYGMTETQLISILWSGLESFMGISKFINPKYVDELFKDGSFKHRVEIMKFCHEFYDEIRNEEKEG